MNIKNSEALFARAQKAIPGGVNSPVRAFKQVGGTPLFIKRAAGAYLFDEDDNRYIDFIGSWGPMLLGHAHPKVVEAIREAALNSTSYGAPTELEIEMAELICSMAPNVDLVRMVSSGTEACMSAIRLARGYTGRNKIIKFEGCYHGHADSFLVKAGSGLATLDIQAVPGVTGAVAADTLTCAYNDVEALEQLVLKHRNEIACIIVEPVAGNMGCILPSKEFLHSMRSVCDEHDIVLIFDEVMTGFRLAPGGAQERLDVEADLITYGKVIGAGMPVGAFGGKRKIMEHIAPLGKVYQAGTLSGNPLAMAAGKALLKELQNNKPVYNSLDEKTAYLHKGLAHALQNHKHCINRMGSMISVHFGKTSVNNFEEAAGCDIELFKQYFHFMLKRGVYLPPSAYETWFVSDAHSYADLDAAIAATRAFADSLLN